MKIEVKKVQKCGTEYLYPMCDFGKLICDIRKKKTIGKRVIEVLKKYGYEVVEV
ncbi:MAG: hypothetical protein IMZ64_03010 [Bacteroidetes bacterium]|nr:hypothetical protein [Bacteroidota bacterium]